MAYHLSTDYDALFAELSGGTEIAAFVDYKLADGVPVHRDICYVRRFGPYQISIASRGMGYGGLDPFNEQDGEERQLFVRYCNAINLGWIEP
jgi:hypothetical protein